MDAYQQYIHKSRYARYLPDEQRRESWEETVNRYLDFWVTQEKLTSKEAKDLYKQIHSLEVMPSMRALMTAGEALSRDNVVGFNCSYLPIDHPKAFDGMYVLMCGTGVGFSVERHTLVSYQKLQRSLRIPIQLYTSPTLIGCMFLETYLKVLWSGSKVDVSELDPGSALRTLAVERLSRAPCRSLPIHR